MLVCIQFRAGHLGLYNQLEGSSLGRSNFPISAVLLRVLHLGVGPCEISLPCQRAYRHCHCLGLASAAMLVRYLGCNCPAISRRHNLTAYFLALWLFRSFCHLLRWSLSLRCRHCVVFYCLVTWFSVLVSICSQELLCREIAQSLHL